MNVTIYVDLVFMTNLAIDGAVLLWTARLRKLQISRLRLLAAAAIGALYAAAMFWVSVPYLYSFAAKVLVSLLMVLISFGYGGPLQMLRTTGAFYTVNFATLGGVIGLSQLVRSSGIDWGGVRYSREGGLLLDWQMQLGLLLVAFLASGLLLRHTFAVKSKQARTSGLIWNVEVHVDGRVWAMKGLLDTGNRLYEPLTRIPVMIMEAAVWKDELPAGWATRLHTETADQLLAGLSQDEAERCSWSHRFRLVPYRTVNGTARMLLAVKPDRVVLSQDGYADLTVSRVLIGLDGGTLSAEGSYRAIVHADMAQTDELAASTPLQPA